MNGEKESLVITLTQKELNQIAVIASREAVAAYRKERVAEERRKVAEENKVKKTRKMLGAYRRMKASVANEEKFTDEEQIELRWKFIEDLMGDVGGISESERIINESERRRQENLYCINRIEQAVNMYREECRKLGTKEAMRRCRELDMMYFGNEIYSVDKIAEVENVSKKTVYKDLGIASNILSVYLLGL